MSIYKYADTIALKAGVRKVSSPDAYVTAAKSELGQQYILGICIGVISSCSLTPSPNECLQQPHAYVSWCSGSSLMTSTRGLYLGNRLRLPLRLLRVTTNSCEALLTGSVKLSVLSKEEGAAWPKLRFTPFYVRTATGAEALLLPKERS